MSARGAGGRCPRAALQPAPGRLRASEVPALKTGTRGARWTGTGFGAGNTRKNGVRSAPRGDRLQIGAPPRPRKHGLGRALGTTSSLWQEPRWDADRRAHRQRCAAVPQHGRLEICVCRRSASFAVVCHCQASAKPSGAAVSLAPCNDETATWASAQPETKAPPLVSPCAASFAPSGHRRHTATRAPRRGAGTGAFVRKPLYESLCTKAFVHCVGWPDCVGAMPKL